MTTQAARDPRRPATQEDVARAVGVSRTLVSFAFRGAPGVSKETREAIFEAAARLGYRQNAAAADLASKRASAVGLYLLDIRNETYAEILSGIRGALEGARNRLVLSVAHSSGGTERAGIESLIEARVGIVIGATLLDSEDHVRELSRSVPVVSVARRIEGVDSVYSDDRMGARAATAHLLSLGHTRIAHFTGPSPFGYQDRELAYEQTMREAGLPPWVVVADDYTQASAERLALRLFDTESRPTAIFAHNDQIALGIREAAYAKGIRVPEDLSLIGYDDSRLARLRGIDLTSVDLGALELGRVAGAAALERLRDPHAPAVDVRSEPSLVVRASTAPPRGSRSR
ncbi:LacI family DNA-binding transcriptional regulator [Sinomonas sp. ASV322]|uniref:LacI family DNA-binding transcriptional regulator n=1 Tax=Sinomonas sp. ASV322 TaxID=3041920 RepID=UPI0027DCB4F8|nr:LacI family DNA-binding transcriptional regulator [Sinomonas sp. ASV322]MDQ4501595.1 LacI family DNA-binding transcriptional regulator [Sinomonas sp. ASV322]